VDVNIVVLCGRLATAPEHRTFDSGSSLLRYLVTVKTTTPHRRVDVLPVTLWDPSQDLIDDPGDVGTAVWVVGTIQRRFWEGPEGRRSRIEIIAGGVTKSRDTSASALVTS
jgi:single-stranded DNA-binding protein